MSGQDIPLDPPSQAKGEMKDGWIAVAERLPEPMDDVLIADAEAVYTDLGWFDGERWHLTDTRHIAAEVTHWMPLPLPPALEVTA